MLFINRDIPNPKIKKWNGNIKKGGKVSIFTLNIEKELKELFKNELNVFIKIKGFNFCGIYIVKITIWKLNSGSILT